MRRLRRLAAWMVLSACALSSSCSPAAIPPRAGRPPLERAQAEAALEKVLRRAQSQPVADDSYPIAPVIIEDDRFSVATADVNLKPYRYAETTPEACAHPNGRFLVSFRGGGDHAGDFPIANLATDCVWFKTREDAEGCLAALLGLRAAAASPGR